MRTQTLSSLLLLLVALSCVSKVGIAKAQGIPDERARTIALSEPRTKQVLRELEAEAERIGDTSRRTDVLSMLDQPEFRVFSARKEHETEILQQLASKGLLGDDGPKPLFSTVPPMRFVAAPGGTWTGHHAYPGGLVYHTLVNVRIGLAIAQTYADVYGISLDDDLIRLAAIWHDCGKPLTIRWKEDGTLEKEARIAGTGAHHIFAIAEAIYREWPANQVVTVASAHSPPRSGADLEALVKFLQAGAIIAGSSYAAAGLTPDGKALAKLPPIEAFVTHLDDHDWVLTETSFNTVARIVDDVGEGGSDFWFRNRLLARDGDIAMYLRLLQHGEAHLRELVKQDSK